jgi:hypothetical protein
MPAISFRPSSDSKASSIDGVPSAWLWCVALASLAWRGWVAQALPLTGDEALFYWWARFLDYGYYDHPPMVAWWIAGARALLGDLTADAAWVMRVPAILLPLGVGGALWWGWSPVDRTRAAWAVLLYWLAPLNWLNAVIVTDSPLILWAAWSTAAMARAGQAQDQGRSAWGLYALGGVFMGLAFLSKYFAVLLGVAFLVHVLGFARARWRGFALMIVCALPAVALNTVWNLNHCWTNVMFNLFNRNEGAEGSVTTLLGYIGMLIYLMGPVLLWFAWQHREDVRRVASVHALPACVVVVPVLFFGLLAWTKTIGLHWLLGFYPFCFLLMALALPASTLRSMGRGLAVWLLLHLAITAGVATTDLRDWHQIKFYHRLVEAARAEEMVQQVREPGVVLASNVYSSAALFGYAIRSHMPVIGPGGVHGRHDDLITDYATLDGRTIRVITTRVPDAKAYEPFFDAVRVLRYEQEGIPFYAVEGVRFRYQAYHDSVLARINRRYYDFPDGLPVWGCAFCERYCGQVRCDQAAASSSFKPARGSDGP